MLLSQKSTVRLNVIPYTVTSHTMSPFLIREDAIFSHVYKHLARHYRPGHSAVKLIAPQLIPKRYLRTPFVTTSFTLMSTRMKPRTNLQCY